MTIKNIIGTMAKGNINMEQFKAIHKELADASDSGKIILLERMEEKDFAQLRTSVKAFVLASVLEQMGTLDAAGLLVAEKAGSLDAMLDSYFVAMFGLLVAEEIV